MDHLLLPSKPSHTLLKVPLVCDFDKPYDDDGDWMTYPARVGWPQAVESTEYPSFGDYDNAHPCDDRELEQFLQAWIWFGLLKLMLGRVGMYDAQDYLENHEPSGDYQSLRKLVHTKTLTQHLNGWSDIALTWPDEQRDEALNDMISALYRAEAVMSVFVVDRNYRDAYSRRHTKFDRGIRLSISALCEVLTNTVYATFAIPGLGPSWTASAMDAEWKPAMANAGWCPGEIAAAREGFKSISAYQYLEYLRKPDLDIEHSGCDAEGCVKLQIDPNTYETLHNRSGCQCPDSGPDRTEILKYLQTGTYPILRVVGDDVSGGISVDTIPYFEGMAYVAISHVWADGLGNPKSNVLPSCQLMKLRSLLASLQGRKKWKDGCESGPPEDRELFLWCDTLCCPVVGIKGPDAAHYKQLSLQRMRMVYTKATYVLVLERSLYLYAYSWIGMIESAMRLFTSRWKQRLWTFQEATLPEVLLIQYSDRAIDFRELFDGAKRLCKSKFRHSHLALDIFSQCLGLRYFFHPPKGDSRKFHQLCFAICHRRVSVSSDEALCVSVVLDLDDKAIAEASTRERRMGILWTMIYHAHRGLPKSIIFNTLPRLERPGLRWAPVTFQLPISHRLEFMNPADESEVQASLCDDGLTVQYSALRIFVPPSFSDVDGGWYKPTRKCSTGSVCLRMDLGDGVRWFTMRMETPWVAKERERNNFCVHLVFRVRLRGTTQATSAFLLLCEFSLPIDKESEEYKSAIQAFKQRLHEIMVEAFEEDRLRATSDEFCRSFATFFIGRYANVLERYDAEHEWCVD